MEPINAIAAVIAILLMAASVAYCSNQWGACEAAGGTPVYEYKNWPSCWDADGRRIFP